MTLKTKNVVQLIIKYFITRTSVQGAGDIPVGQGPVLVI